MNLFHVTGQAGQKDSVTRFSGFEERNRDAKRLVGGGGGVRIDNWTERKGEAEANANVSRLRMLPKLTDW
jgi:hypothetical protein